MKQKRILSILYAYIEIHTVHLVFIENFVPLSFRTMHVFDRSVLQFELLEGEILFEL